MNEFELGLASQSSEPQASALADDSLRLDDGVMARLVLEARWEDDSGEHQAIEVFEKFNVWRDLDLLPRSMVGKLRGQAAGFECCERFGPGELVPPCQPGLRMDLARERFVGRLGSGQLIEPVAGRFYPKGMVAGVPGFFSEDHTPMRVCSLDEVGMTVDFNHPLCAQSIELCARVEALYPSQSEHGGRCMDAVTTLLSGPGMQCADGDSRNGGLGADFFAGSALARMDEREDGLFYETVRRVQHLDAVARGHLTTVYERLLRAFAGGRLLDLMASWESHLPPSMDWESTIGLGMNSEEMAANPALSEFLVQDLNAQARLPFGDAGLDVVLCTASVEYLTDPQAVFAELGRVLRPGGICVMAFSDRWFPSKAISLWSEMHPFERPGYVRALFEDAGWADGVNSFSLRGDARPEDDAHFAQSAVSDPVFVVWALKSAN